MPLRLMVMENKKCSKCKIIFGIFEYFICRKSRSGYQSWCKKCKRISVANAPSSNLPSRTKEQAIARYYKNRISFNFSRRIRLSLKGRKSTSWRKLVKYNLNDLKNHLEKHFTSEMNWNNYGKIWHIDHKKPVSSFNIISEKCEDFKKCWELDNLRPLLAIDNIKKGNKIIK